MAHIAGVSHAAPQSSGSASAQSGSSLIICRNKHWRFISAFHGPWLQLPPEVLQSLAYQNFYMPRPRLIDPAVFFDVVKIRRVVDEATEDAVRASTGVSPNQSNNSLWMDPYGGGGAPPPKMSKERTHKIRQKAVKSLAKAYALDEVAASVATMQSTSSLEDVAQHVLKKDKVDLDSRYVHFFHEKIPSRMMEQYTPLEPLSDIIQSLPFEARAPPLRTRGLVKIFKHELEAAVADFTLSLRTLQEIKLRHKPGQDQLVLASQFAEERNNWNKSGRDWRSVPQIKEEDQPTGLEQQLLFNRGGVYLTLASQNVEATLHGLKEYQAKSQQDASTSEPERLPALTAADKHAHSMRLEARKRVKGYAKRALRDFVAFLSHLDYSPGLSLEVTNEIMRRVHDLANGTKARSRALKDREAEDEYFVGARSSTSNAMVRHQQGQKAHGSKADWNDDGWPKFAPPKVHPASALFAEKPPAGVPNFPANEDIPAGRDPLSTDSREAVTYHPLLGEVLHSLLLAHALLQTSSTELQRHAHNAARLLRITDGYPIFQSARSPSRADFVEILRRTRNWLGLNHSWSDLCAPAPYPDDMFTATANGSDVSKHAKENGQVSMRHKEKPAESENTKRDRMKQQAIFDALGDDRVVDQETFEQAVKARTARAFEDDKHGEYPVGEPESHPTMSGSSANGTSKRRQSSTKKRWNEDDDPFDYPISTERANAITRWILEAPLSVGGGGKKRRPAKKKRPGQSTSKGISAAVNGIDRMHLDGSRDDSADMNGHAGQDEEEVD